MNSSPRALHVTHPIKNAEPMIQKVICHLKIILLAELKEDLNLDSGLFPFKQEELENNADDGLLFCTE